MKIEGVERTPGVKKTHIDEISAPRMICALAPRDDKWLLPHVTALASSMCE